MIAIQNHLRFSHGAQAMTCCDSDRTVLRLIVIHRLKDHRMQLVSDKATNPVFHRSRTLKYYVTFIY